MPQLPIRGFQPFGARRDHLFEAQNVFSDQLVVFPFAAERRGALQNFDGLGGVAQHQQPVGGAPPRHHLPPVVVRVGRTDDHLHVRRPGPPLVTRNEPPSSWAASAPLCKPKPWPSTRVVKPCVNRRDIFSAGMPTPLSTTHMRTPAGAGSTRRVMSLSVLPDSSHAYLALRTRFTRICRTLCLSTVIGGTSPNSRHKVTP